MTDRHLAAALAGLALAGCSTEASEGQILQALVECDAEHQARIVRSAAEGSSPLVVDFDLEGPSFDEKADCVRVEVEKLGVKSPTMMGGPGSFSEAPVENPPMIDPEALGGAGN